MSSQHAMFIADCPRCGDNKVTFDILASVYAGKPNYSTEYECYLLCRSCANASNALVRERNSNASDPKSFSGRYINQSYKFVNWVFDIPNSRKVPEHVDSDVARIFTEAADCLAIGAYDASGTMFRKVLDAATRMKTPSPDSDHENKPQSWKIYKDLRLRLDWLFAENLLDRSLQDLSTCIHQDGNDAAHDLVGIGREEAEDLADFADQVLRVIFTTPGQIAENQRRRSLRRGITD